MNAQDMVEVAKLIQAYETELAKRDAQIAELKKQLEGQEKK